MKQIAKNVITGLAKIGEETGRELVKETGKIGETIISGRELLGDIKPLTESEMAERKMEEERKKREEMAKMLQGLGEPGRKVEKEMEEVRSKKKEEEERQEKEFLAGLQRQREEEAKEREMMEAEVSSSSAKRKKKRGSAFLPGRKQGATAASQSATAEYFKKPD